MGTGANASQRRRNNNISIFNFNKSIIINNWIRWVCNQEVAALYLFTSVAMIFYTNRALYTLVSEFKMYVQQCLLHGKLKESSDEVMRERKWMQKGTKQQQRQQRTNEQERMKKKNNPEKNHELAVHSVFSALYIHAIWKTEWGTKKEKEKKMRRKKLWNQVSFTLVAMQRLRRISASDFYMLI